MTEFQPQQPFEQQPQVAGSDTPQPLTTADLVSPGRVEAPQDKVPHLTQAQFEQSTRQLEQTTCAGITRGGESEFNNFHARLWHASKDAIGFNDTSRIKQLIQVSDMHVQDATGHIATLSAKLHDALAASDN